jgi:hypothetical protein
MKQKRKPDPLLKCCPWRIFAVFQPIEQILSRLEIDGTIEVAGRQVVFKEDSKGGYYDAPAALRGVAEFHDLAATRHHIPANTTPLWQFAAKLDAGMPLFEADIAAVRASINSCKQQAMHLRVSQAESILRTVQIGEQLDKIGGKAA